MTGSANRDAAILLVSLLCSHCGPRLRCIRQPIPQKVMQPTVALASAEDLRYV